MEAQDSLHTNLIQLLGNALSGTLDISDAYTHTLTSLTEHPAITKSELLITEETAQHSICTVPQKSVEPIPRKEKKHKYSIYNHGERHIYLVVHTAKKTPFSDTAIAIHIDVLRSLVVHDIQQQSITKLTGLLNNEIDAHHICKNDLKKIRSEKEQIQEKLEDQKRHITDAIVQTQELERRRIARELHDSLGNTLSMIKLLLSSLAHEYGEGQKRYTDILQRSIGLLDSAIDEIRQVSQNLASDTLIEHGLITTLKEMIGRINASRTLHAEFQVFGLTSKLPLHIEQNLFRILQELIQNVIKHAKATELILQCIEHDQSIIVMIEDNGIGMDTSIEQYKEGGMGLQNVRTRLTIINGSMAIDSSPSRGTIITLDIPLSG